MLRAPRGDAPLTEVLDTGRFDLEAAQASAAWIAELSGRHTPETEEYGIASFVYEARAPFHPERFMDLIHHGDWAGVIRSKGFFWIATRPRWVYHWSQAGGACSFEVTGQWWAAVPHREWPEVPEDRARILSDWHGDFGDRRQQIAIIGRDLDERALRAALDASLLTADERRLGLVGWTTLSDPFPPEETSAPHQHAHSAEAD